jgi:hypothetical protein
MVLPNASRFARMAGLGAKLRRRRLACGIFKCAAEVTQNETLQDTLRLSSRMPV